MRRSGKFYRHNERDVMERLGLQPTINSGSGWVQKEDGQNDDVICQLKSTDAQSIVIKLQDIQTLLYNAGVAHKIPVFAIQFLQSQDLFLLVQPGDLEEIVSFVKTGVIHGNNFDALFDGIGPKNDSNPVKTKNSRVIRSSDGAREDIRQSIRDKQKKKSRSAL